MLSSREEEFQRNNAFSLNNLHVYMDMPLHKNPSLGGLEIYNFVKLFSGHHYYILSLSELCPGGQKKDLKLIYKFLTWLLQIQMYVMLIAVEELA